MNGKINITTGWPANIMRNGFSLTTERRGSVCVSCVLTHLWFIFLWFINATCFSFFFSLHLFIRINIRVSVGPVQTNIHPE